MAADNVFTLPGFNNLKELAHGGNSRVYSGTRAIDNKDVVLKVRIIDEDEKDPSLRRIVDHRIYGLKEYDIGSYFDCDFIAKYIEYSADKRYTYTIMEREQSSMTVYKNEIKIPFQEKVSLLKKLLTGLNECHENGILHLDMKFENVLMRARVRSGIQVDEPLITDFGFSLRCRSVRSGVKVTSKFGTVGYFAPEQFASYYSDDATKRNMHIYRGSADVWAFGIIAFRLLMDSRVYNNPGDKEAIQTDMIRYFQKNNVRYLIRRREYESFNTLSSDDKDDVLQLLSGALEWRHDLRLNTRQLLDLPIFRKSVKLKMSCGLSRSGKKYTVSNVTKSLPCCLSYVGEIIKLFPNAQIIIYYHLIDLIYRICSIPKYKNIQGQYAKEAVVACLLIVLNYHYVNDLTSIHNYINDNDMDLQNILYKTTDYAKSLKYDIYRRYLYESATSVEDMIDQITNIIPIPNKYIKFTPNIVNANPNVNQDYDQPSFAYITVRQMLPHINAGKE